MYPSQSNLRFCLLYATDSLIKGNHKNKFSTVSVHKSAIQAAKHCLNGALSKTGTACADVSSMKMIQAIIRREKLGDVKKALDGRTNPGMMVWEIMGHGKQKGMTEQFLGRDYKLDFIPKTKIEIIVPDDQAQSIIDTILKTASTGQIGDGKIFVFPVEDAIRIRTGEKGEAAVR